VEPLSLEGSQVSRVEQVNPWTLVIVLRDGRKIIVEPDFYPEIRGCDPDRDADDCYLENLFLRVYEGGGEG
jgi:hypothetical protein